jgi:hypothetical protein
MSKSYSCNDQGCKGSFLFDLGDVIDHLRFRHSMPFICRPHGSGTPDGHGNLWYCFQCNTKPGRDHRSFQSDEAMWNHLHACHKHEFKFDIVRKKDEFLDVCLSVNDVLQRRLTKWTVTACLGAFYTKENSVTEEPGSP